MTETLLNSLTTAVNEASQSRDWPAAVKLSQELRDRFPENQTGYKFAAIAFKMSGQYNEAEKILDSAKEKFGSPMWLDREAALLAVASGNLLEALTKAEALRNRVPDEPAGYFVATGALRILRRFSEAQPILNLARQRFPGQAWVLVQAAQLAEVAGDYETLIQEAEILLRDHPENPAGYCPMIRGLRHLGRLEEAEDILQTAMQNFPEKAWMVSEQAELKKQRAERELFTSNRPPIIRFFNEAIIVPAEPSDDALKLQIGGFSPDGQLLDGFKLVRFYGQSGDPVFREGAKSVQGDITYGGFFGNHFGHFLLETLSRLWWLRRSGTEQILWHSWTKSITAWQRDIFALAGISTERFVFAIEPLHVRNITVADPGFVIGLSFHPAQVEALALVQFNPPLPQHKVWLSRSALPVNKDHIYGETEIEDELRKLGWSIVFPEKLSITEQLAALMNASTIAGFQGSAFHILILAKECRAKIRIVTRHAKLHPNYLLIANAKKLQQTELSPAIETNEYDQKRVLNIGKVVDFVNAG